MRSPLRRYFAGILLAASLLSSASAGTITSSTGNQGGSMANGLALSAWSPFESADDFGADLNEASFAPSAFAGDPDLLLPPADANSGDFLPGAFDLQSLVRNAALPAVAADADVTGGAFSNDGLNVPDPSTTILFGTGLILIAIALRRARSAFRK